MTGLFAIIFLAALVGVFKPYIKGLKRWHFGLAALAALLVVGVTAPPQEKKAATGAAPDRADSEQASATVQSGGAKAAPEKPVSKWSYSEDKDEMRGEITRFATLQSENEIDLQFPYGVVRGALTVRHRKEDGLNVMFSVEKGQVLCNSFTNTHVSVKFDDKPIQRFACTGTSDGSSETAFITQAGRFLSQLRAAKRVIVEAEFYQQGRQQFTFDTAGLEWK